MMRNFLRDEQGQDLIEYTLLLAFVALASAALFIGAGGSVSTHLDHGQHALGDAATSRQLARGCVWGHGSAMPPLFFLSGRVDGPAPRAALSKGRGSRSVISSRAAGGRPVAGRRERQE